ASADPTSCAAFPYSGREPALEPAKMQMARSCMTVHRRVPLRGTSASTRHHDSSDFLRHRRVLGLLRVSEATSDSGAIRGAKAAQRCVTHMEVSCDALIEIADAGDRGQCGLRGDIA